MKLVFGAFLRYDEGDVISSRIDTIYDAVESAVHVDDEGNEVPKFTDDDWSYMAWNTDTTIYLVFAATLGVRAELIKVEGLRIAPLSVVAERMSDNRNNWVLPVPTSTRSAYDIAAERLQEWLNGLFASEQITVTREVEDEAVRDLKSRRERMKRTREGVPTPPSEDVLAAFGVSGNETDSEGIGFKFVQL